MKCVHCGVNSNGLFMDIYWFECGNAYDTITDLWVDLCGSEPLYPQ